MPDPTPLIAWPLAAILMARGLAPACAADQEAAKIAVAPAPYGATPTPAQVKHAARAFYAFCHFTVDTFTDREWGTGGESETTFNPTQFDADQIVGALRASGAKGVILVCKHHDGFCLWPTASTAHNISRSPFRGGKGDVVREFADACHRLTMDFGVYVSPWDRNNAAYGKPAYVTDVFRAQIGELTTNYGPLFEVWFDGANGGTGYYKGAVGPVEAKEVDERRTIDATTYYGWPTTWALVLRNQPEAIMFSDVGPGVRWVGNEHGHADDPCRATITYPDDAVPGSHIPRGLLGPGTIHGQSWCPAEVDVSIRPGWFWHASEDGRVRPPDDLMRIYLDSVGHGALLNLNCPPDRRGLLNEVDVASLAAFGEHLRETFARNLAADAKPTASDVRGDDAAHFGPQRLIDDDPWSAWVTNDAVTATEVVMELPAARTFTLIRLREDIRLGLRVEGVAIDALVDGAWNEIAKAESVGACHLWRVPATTTGKVRIRVTKAPVCPALSDFGLFMEPAFGPWVPPVGPTAGAAQKAAWKIVSASFAAPGGEARNAIDGDPGTLWRTDAADGERHLPQEIVVDLGQEKTVAGFTCLPRQDKAIRGMVDQYAFSTSPDGSTWKPAAEGEFGNLRANPVEQSVEFPPVKARYFKFVAKHCLEGDHAAIAEIGIIEGK